MSDTIKIEMTMPVPPDGFRYKAYRAPLNGEHYRLPSGKVAKAECEHPFDMPAPILERVPWVPKPGEMVWYWSPRAGITNFPFDGAFPLVAFRTESDAVEFGQQVLALADRIRAESEATNE